MFENTDEVLMDYPWTIHGLSMELIRHIAILNISTHINNISDIIIQLYKGRFIIGHQILVLQR